MLKNKLSKQRTTSNRLHRARRLYLQAQPQSTYTYNVTPHQAYQYRGDFYGLLKELGEPIDLQLLTLEQNNLDSSIMYDGFTEIKLINMDYIPTLMSMHDTLT